MTASSHDRRSYEAAQLHLARLRVAGGAPLSDALRETTRVAAETLGVERVGIWLFVEERRAIRCHQLYESRPHDHSEGAVLRAADFPIYFSALEGRRDLAASDARTGALTHELQDAYLVPLGIESMLDVPIYRGGEIVGIVCHEASAKREWSDADRAFAISVADSVARQMEESARVEAEARLGAHEEQWIEIQKMEALGRLAAGVAHDFRNLLSVIVAYADEIRRRVADAPLAKAAGEILSAAERGTVLVRDLLAFGREQRSESRVLDPCEAVEALRSMLRTACGSTHPIEIRYQRPVGKVLIDRSQLERVVLNPAINARDALPRGGPISISLVETEVIAAAGESGVYVVLEVRDEGVGMDRETQSRIFEPFFTTKATGSGIGLAVVYRVIERAGGFVHVESEPGRGTSIRAYLPRVAAGGIRAGES